MFLQASSNDEKKAAALDDRTCDVSSFIVAEANGVSHFPPRQPAAGQTIGSVRDSLRTATAEAHQALHRATPFARIAAGEIDRQGYISLLRALQRFHGTMAPFCRVACAALGAPALLHYQVNRLDRLRRDLAFFGLAWPQPDNLPTEEAGEAFSIGCLYTVQGSSLGGGIIHKQLGSFLPTAEGREFFQATPEDGSLWRDFCTRLDYFGADRLSEVEAGAAHAFDFFRICLERSS